MNDLDAMMQAVDAANPEPVGNAIDEAPDKDNAKEESKADDKPLELTPDDEAVDLEEGEEGGEEHQDADGKRRRSKPASQRIAELTARLRERERELEALAKPKTEEASPERPKPEDFEFGEADPAFIKADLRYDMALEAAEKAKASEAAQSQRAMIDKIGLGVSKAEEVAKEKYEDFDTKIAEAVEARGGDPLPPILSIGISVSPVGGDILYRLATDDAVSSRLEKLATSEATAPAMAMAFGELEGEYLDDDSDSDLDMTDQLDMARMMGRMRARLKGAKAPAPKQAEIPVTNAPEPPAQRARGSSSRTKVSAETEDTAAFFRDFGKEIGIR